MRIVFLGRRLLEGLEHLIVDRLCTIFRLIAPIPGSKLPRNKQLTVKSSTVNLDFHIGKYVAI
jgi:hypothetical protein